MINLITVHSHTLQIYIWRILYICSYFSYLLEEIRYAQDVQSRWHG